jgi:hypothetical protein
MTKRIFLPGAARLLAVLLLIGPAWGCARNQGAALPPPDASSAPPAPPEGLRLGAFYVSALNEECYEAFPLDGPSARPRAYCRRSASWLLLPDIYPDLPYGAPWGETAPDGAGRR